MKNLNFEQMTNVQGGASAANYACNGIIWGIGAVYSCAIGAFSFGLGLLAGFASTMAAVKICENVK